MMLKELSSYNKKKRMCRYKKKNCDQNCIKVEYNSDKTEYILIVSNNF